MLELTLNSPFTFVVSGPDTVTTPLPQVYVDGALSNQNILVTPLGTGATNLYSLTYTPSNTGTHSFVAFGQVKLTLPCYARPVTSMIANIEDESIGSWTWDKNTGSLTMLRQNGTTLATFNAQDSLTSASRERL